LIVDVFNLLSLPALTLVHNPFPGTATAASLRCSVKIRIVHDITVSRDVTPNYVPHAIRGLSTSSVLFGEGEDPAEAGAEAKQDAAKAAGAL
jgi:hypothetical protein